MSATFVKVCDVRDVGVLEECARLGVHFVGLHAIHGPIADEKLELFREIRAASTSCKLVMVTREANLETLLTMATQLDWDLIQVHSELSIADTRTLRDELVRIAPSTEVVSVIETSSLDFERVAALSAIADYLLFDSSIVGGTGVCSDMRQLRQMTRFAGATPYFVAGGLKPENVGGVVRHVRPFAVDVQSGVEIPGGSRAKDPERIRAFVDAVEKASCPG